MRVSLCCIAKLENNYIRDFCRYYINLGVDHITIYDNNDPDGERIEPVIEDFVALELVDVIYARGKKAFQMKAYEEYFENNKDKYDWILYFDVDEYLYIENGKNIKEYLSCATFMPDDLIHVNWKIYDDNDQLYYKNQPVMERFTREMDPDKCCAYDFPENDHIKSIVRTDIPIKPVFGNPHTIKDEKKALKVCDNAGNVVENDAFIHPYNWDKAHLKHYKCKTIEEFVRIRLKRGRATTTNNTINIDMFKKHNAWTPDKEKVYNNLVKNIESKS